MIAQLESNIYGERKIVFTVPLPHKQPVFMSLKVSEYENNPHGFFFVNSEKFLRLWRANKYDSYERIADGKPETWRNDRKFSYAAEGFSLGRENPVPLANISFGASVHSIVSYNFLCFGKKSTPEEIPFISITNGITRTIWLLSQGCEAFPVKCEISSARDLYRIAAADSANFYTTDDFLNSKVPDPNLAPM